jgi:hypothetical protein
MFGGNRPPRFVNEAEAQQCVERAADEFEAPLRTSRRGLQIDSDEIRRRQVAAARKPGSRPMRGCAASLSTTRNAAGRECCPSPPRTMNREELLVTETTPQPAASQSADPEQQADALRALLRTDDIPWPIANPRQQPHRVAVREAVSMIAGVLDRLEWEHVEIRKNVETWRAKQPELAAALAVFVPLIITRLANREALISEGLEWLVRLEASYSGDDARDSLLDNLTTFNAITAGQMPE